MPEPELEVRGARAWVLDTEQPETGHSDLVNQPDYVGPDYLVPEPPDLRPPERPDPPPPEPPGDVSREELEIALERAKLVADDCATILDPAIQAMKDGAWVSRAADEFSLALEGHARMAADAGERQVETIKEAFDRHLGDGGGAGDDYGAVQPRLVTPVPTVPRPKV